MNEVHDVTGHSGHGAYIATSKNWLGANESPSSSSSLCRFVGRGLLLGSGVVVCSAWMQQTWGMKPIVQVFVNNRGKIAAHHTAPYSAHRCVCSDGVCVYRFAIRRNQRLTATPNAFRPIRENLADRLTLCLLDPRLAPLVTRLFACPLPRDKRTAL